MAILKPSGVIATYSSGDEREPKIPLYELLLNGITVYFLFVYQISQAAHEQTASDANPTPSDTNPKN